MKIIRKLKSLDELKKLHDGSFDVLIDGVPIKGKIDITDWRLAFDFRRFTDLFSFITSFRYKI
jgi:hypothetical protein